MSVVKGFGTNLWYAWHNLPLTPSLSAYKIADLIYHTYQHDNITKANLNSLFPVREFLREEVNIAGPIAEQVVRVTCKGGFTCVVPMDMPVFEKWCVVRVLMLRLPKDTMRELCKKLMSIIFHGHDYYGKYQRLLFALLRSQPGAESASAIHVFIYDLCVSRVLRNATVAAVFFNLVFMWPTILACYNSESFYDTAVREFIINRLGRVAGIQAVRLGIPAPSLAGRKTPTIAETYHAVRLKRYFSHHWPKTLAESMKFNRPCRDADAHDMGLWTARACMIVNRWIPGDVLREMVRGVVKGRAAKAMLEDAVRLAVRGDPGPDDDAGEEEEARDVRMAPNDAYAGLELEDVEMYGTLTEAPLRKDADADGVVPPSLSNAATVGEQQRRHAKSPTPPPCRYARLQLTTTPPGVAEKTSSSTLPGASTVPEQQTQHFHVQPQQPQPLEPPQQSQLLRSRDTQHSELPPAAIATTTAVDSSHAADAPFCLAHTIEHVSDPTGAQEQQQPQYPWLQPPHELQSNPQHTPTFTIPPFPVPLTLQQPPVTLQPTQTPPENPDPTSQMSQQAFTTTATANPALIENPPVAQHVDVAMADIQQGIATLRSLVE